MTPGVESVEFDLPGTAEPGRALVAVPSGGPSAGPHPGVLVLHDLLGLQPDTERTVRRLADAGYVGFAPDFFGPGWTIACVARAVLSLRRGRGGSLDRIEAAERSLRARADVDGTRIGVIGFCMGGGFAVLHANRADVDAAAVFYGDVPSDADGVAGLPPCFARYGGRDRIFAPQGERLRDHLDGLGIDNDVVVHPEAGHGFMNDHDHWLIAVSARTPMRTAYHEALAERAWADMLDWFDHHLNHDRR